MRNNEVRYKHLLSKHLGAKESSNRHCNSHTKPLWLFQLQLRQLLVAVESPVLLSLIVGVGLHGPQKYFDNKLFSNYGTLITCVLVMLTLTYV